MTDGKRFALSALVALACLLALVACGPEPVREVVEEPVPTTAAPPIESSPEASSDPFVGVIVSRQAVDIASEISGIVVDVEVRVGDRVERGARLAVLETRDLNQDLVRAQAGVTAAEAEARRIEVEVRRAGEQLRRRQALPDLFAQEELDSAESQLEIATAELESARARVAEQKAQVTQLQNRIGRSVLRAPIDGRVASRFLDPGARVEPGAAVLRLIASEEFVLRFAVPPPTAANLQPGDRVEASFDTLDGQLTATVSHIAPQVDTASQLVFVEADLDGASALQGQLQDGLVARIRRNPT